MGEADLTGLLFDEEPHRLSLLSARIPTSKSSYADSEWWRRRYAASEEEASYDWCSTHPQSRSSLSDGFLALWPRYSVSYSSFRAAARQAGCTLSAGDVVLQLGCGTSSFGGELARDGVLCLESDVDAALLARLAGRLGSETTQHLSFAALDALRLGVRTACCDYVLEKGTLDALSAAGPLTVQRAVGEALRVLRAGGTLLSISAQPQLLLACLSDTWRVTHIPLHDPGENIPSARGGLLLLST